MAAGTGARPPMRVWLAPEPAGLVHGGPRWRAGPCRATRDPQDRPPNPESKAPNTRPCAAPQSARRPRERTRAASGSRPALRLSLLTPCPRQSPGPSLPSAPPRGNPGSRARARPRTGKGRWSFDHWPTGQLWSNARPLVKCPPEHPHHAGIHSEPGRVGPGSHAASGLRAARGRGLEWTRMDSDGLGWTRMDSDGLVWTRMAALDARPSQPSRRDARASHAGTAMAWSGASRPRRPDAAV